MKPSQPGIGKGETEPQEVKNMAKATVKLICQKCGKEFSVSKEFHKRAEADNWEKYITKMGNGTCPECWKAEKEEEKEKTILENRAKLEEAVKSCPLSLPTLSGSEKQIAWATDLRNGVIAQMVGKKFYWDKAEEKAKADPAVKTEWDKLFNNSAKWWIESRGNKIFNFFVIGE